ncbi:hypothetical protein YY92_05595 [Campylobacter fetus]|uniref:hypothetical protein n=1 Tax=Campylobacter fetus TaxID=196 RepID=UPI0011C871D2|nr:hypothetical protein [Campylobacter fetus]EAJ1232371.1 hypothetical protein [Campylobacter fetus]EAK0414200.1 hypothetical protein [Campylobacter fetus]TXF08759.1 hypothetical protein FPD25_04510 [Campylobacter fetus subsp. fetus]
MLQAIAYLFGILGFLISYLFNKITSISAFLAVLSINAVVLGLFLTYLKLLSDVILFFYKNVNSLINYFNKLVTSDGIIGYFIDIISSIGMLSAFQDVFVIFSVFFNTMFSLIASKYAVKGLLFMRESILSLVISKLN